MGDRRTEPTPGQTASLVRLINDMAPIGPTFREIGGVWDIRSLSVIRNRLNYLKSKGVIDWSTNRARSIHIRRAEFFTVKKDGPNYDAYLSRMRD